MKSHLSKLVLSLALLSSGAAIAGAECTDEPREKWIPRQEMQKKILDRFKIDDSCYEIYGRDADNRKVEIYFNPVTGEVVKQETDS
jgi:hypothetical protein